jgi:iron-sulfur cluster assembly protein
LTEEKPISFTDKALLKVKAQLNELSLSGVASPFLRLGIKGGSCAGYSYMFKYESGVLRDIDQHFDFYGVLVVIDDKSITYLNGTVIDWEDSLMFQGFKFINPNVKSECGCGQSVSF